MLVIADNLNIRNTEYMGAVKRKDGKAIETMAKDLAGRGAELINVQVSPDGSGDEALLPFVTEAIQKGAGIPLCLDSRNVKALSKAIPLCEEPPIINYISADEKNPDDLLALVSKSKSNLIVRALKGTVPSTLEAKLLIIEDLLEKANAADIPNERLFADPSVVHISKGMGQEHLLNAHESIIVLNEMVDPPLNTVIWLSNVTTSLPKNLKSTVASSYLSYLAGAGLNAAIVDVRDREIMKAVYLIKTFRDETTFAAGDLA
ncbi:MAG TPA: dihydropteroate synthase [Nitrospirota bacterium]|nr:dihydropteroate synthase [Nitrospirota bacterium]